MNLRRYIRQVTRANRKFEVKYYPKVKAALQLKVNRLIEALKAGGYAAGFAHLNRDVGNPALARVIRQLYQEVGLFHARNSERLLRNELAGKKFWQPQPEQKDFRYAGTWLQTIIEYLRRNLLDLITFEVSATQRARLLRILQEAQGQGWGLDKTVSELKALPFTEMQAARIVRTEITRATGAGNHAQGETFEYEINKTWIAARDHRVRGLDPKDHASHDQLNRQTVDADDYFRDPRNGDLLLFPGDPGVGGNKTRPESTINCRCVHANRLKRDSDGKPIPKKRVSRISVILPGQIRRPQTVTI